MDPIRRHLEQRGVAAHVVEGGLDYLVSTWEQTAAETEAGEWWWGYEDWLDDLDTRNIIQDLFDNVPESRTAVDAVERADKQFDASTIPTDECQGSDANAARRGWTPERNWWYWREPP